jgi:hypothetical protein
MLCGAGPTGAGVWPTRLKAGRLLMAMAAATVAELGAQPNRRTLRIAP